jgi:hypothetical protein
VDFTEDTDEALEMFEGNGMHRVRSTDPILTWPGMEG